MAEFHTPPQGVSTVRDSQTGTRKHTPYTKTPRTRRITGGRARLSRTRTPEDDLNLEEIANKTWRAYKVTPLFQFNHGAQDLKVYSKLLGAYLEAETVKGIGFETEQVDKAILSVFSGLDREGDKPAVKIVIKSKPHPSTGVRRDAVVAILCSVDAGVTNQSRLGTSFTSLPVLLTRGLAGLISLLISWLKSQFDCHISHMNFSSFDLAWMVAFWAGSGNERRGAKPTELVYNVPAECKGLSKITLSIEPQDCEKLWSSIHDSNVDEFSDEEVDMFLKSLESHFYHHFRVKLAALHLATIGTSIVYVGSEGRIKVFSKDHIHQILRHVTELALEHVMPAE